MTHATRPSVAIQTSLDAVLVATFVTVSIFVLASWLLHSVPAHAVPWIKSLLVAPVVEEFFFRGVMQSSLRERGTFRGRPWGVIIVTALCFGLLHLVSAPAAHAALVVAPALAIGCVFERTQSVALCIVLHSASNAIWLTFWST